MTESGTGPATFGGNDLFANASRLDTASGDFEEARGSNAGFSTEDSEPMHAWVECGASAWFDWVAPADGVLTVDTFGTSMDTVLAAYTGSALDALTAVGGNDDFNIDPKQSLMSFAVKSGVTYHIVLATRSGQTGEYDLRWEFAQDGTASVWRYYDKTNGSHMYTADPTEATSLYGQGRRMYDYDGRAYTINQRNALNATSLWRFYNMKILSYFYTADVQERKNVVENLSSTYRLEGSAYTVCTTPTPGATTVWRFYNMKNGTHFYTTDLVEKASVDANLRDTYRFEGPAFYLAP